MTTNKDHVLQTLRSRVKDRRENKLRYFSPYPKQMEFFAATLDHGEVACMAGNQVGKSMASAFMTACYLTGIYPSWWPGRRFDHPVKIWSCGESSVSVRDINQAQLLGP